MGDLTRARNLAVSVVAGRLLGPGWLLCGIRDDVARDLEAAEVEVVG